MFSMTWSRLCTHSPLFTSIKCLNELQFQKFNNFRYQVPNVVQIKRAEFVCCLAVLDKNTAKKILPQIKTKHGLVTTGCWSPQAVIFLSVASNITKGVNFYIIENLSKYACSLFFKSTSWQLFDSYRALSL